MFLPGLETAFLTRKGRPYRPLAEDTFFRREELRRGVLKKIIALEEKINQLLRGAAKKTSSAIKVPRPKATAIIKGKINSQVNSLQSKVKNIKEISTKKIETTKAQVKSGVQQAKSTNWKEVKPKHVALFVGTVISPWWKKIMVFFVNLKPITIVSTVALTSLGALGGLSIYKQAGKMAEKDRTPAAVKAEKKQQEFQKMIQAGKRPEYLRRKEKQFQVYNVVLPAYFGGDKNRLNKVILDFTIESSNKYIREYFFTGKRDHVIHDVLNTKVEPISVDFPLENEGKIIIKDKIKEELNKKIKDLGIKGEIREIYIHSLMGG